MDQSSGPSMTDEPSNNITYSIMDQSEVPAPTPINFPILTFQFPPMMSMVLQNNDNNLTPSTTPPPTTTISNPPPLTYVLIQTPTVPGMGMTIVPIKPPPNCVNCSALPLPPGSGVVRGQGHSSINSKLKKRLPTSQLRIEDAIFELFGQKPIAHSQICGSCLALLHSLYLAHENLLEKKKSFTNSTSPNSFIAGKLCEKMGVGGRDFSLDNLDTPPPPPPSPPLTTMILPPIPPSDFEELKYKYKENIQTSENTESTEKATQTEGKLYPKPLTTGESIHAARNNIRSRGAFLGALKRIIRNECRDLMQMTCLNEGFKEGEDFLSLMIIDKELERKAPTVRAILEGLCPSRLRGKDKVRVNYVRLSMLAMSLNFLKQSCNRFQKIVGLLLWKRSNEDTYTILKKLGLTCSYKTVTSMLDKAPDGSLQKIFDRSVRLEDIIIDEEKQFDDDKAENEGERNTNMESEEVKSKSTRASSSQSKSTKMTRPVGDSQESVRKTRKRRGSPSPPSPDSESESETQVDKKLLRHPLKIFVTEGPSTSLNADSETEQEPS